MARRCIECDAEMSYDEKLHLWRCPRCNLLEEGEEPLEPGKGHQYKGYRQGGALRSQKR